MNISKITLPVGAVFLLASFYTRADNYTFSADELENTSQTVAKDINVAQFNKAENLPGTYYVSVKLNGHRFGKMNVKFVSAKDGSLIPLFSTEQCRLLHLDPESRKEIKSAPADAFDLTALYPGAHSRFNFSQQQLDIDIPQIYFTADKDSKFGVSPAQWDEGINAVLLNYDISGSQIKEDGGHFDSGDRFMKLNSGINIGAWRLRNQSMLDKPEEGASTWNGKNTWIQRDVPILAGSFSAGNRASDALLFDGFTFSGLALATSQNMLSDKVKGYAPAIRGIARTTNARVQVSQNGSVIYQSYVPAGAFEIRDLYPQSGGGELQVSIKETDGSEHHFTQGWGNVPVMQRAGYLKYSLEAGRYDNSDQSASPHFYQTSLFYGLPHAMTVFGGIQLAEDYSAGDLGYAFSLGLAGAISVDVTTMTDQIDPRQATTHGKNYRFQYAIALPQADTNISVSWAISPDRGYTSFANAVQNLDEDDATLAGDTQRKKLQISASQPLFNSGSLTFSMWQTEYWNHEQDKSLSLNYNQAWHSLTLNLGWSWTQDMDGGADQQLACNVQIPLSIFSSDTWINTGVNLQRPGAASQSLTLNGDALSNTLSWGVGATNGDNRNFNAQGDFKGRYGEYQASYSDTSSSRELTYRTQGSLLASRYGVTAGQPFDLKNSVALVDATNAGGLQVSNNPGVMTDARGLAVVPYLQPYREDAISLDPTGIEGDTTLDNTEVHLVPTDSAVVLASFTAHTGRKILVTLHKPDGEFVPFGATVTAGEQSNEGIVDDRGQVFLSGVPDDGQIAVKWGDASQQCQSKYNLHPKTGKHIYEIKLVCA
jgi:outer membrane usher protein